MQLTEQRIREIVREEIRAALEERDAAKKTALIEAFKKLGEESLDFTILSSRSASPTE